MGRITGNVLTYKNFIGSINFSVVDNLFFGKIEGINDLVTFEGSTVIELEKAFREMVDAYELDLTEDVELLDLSKEQEANSLLSEKDKEIFFNALLNPDEPNESLKKAAERYRDLNKLLKKASKKNIHKETDTGKPSGNEEL